MAKLKQETLGEITSHLYVLESEAGAKWIYELYVGSTTRDNNISVYLGKYRDSKSSNTGDWVPLKSSTREEAIVELKELVFNQFNLER